MKFLQELVRFNRLDDEDDLPEDDYVDAESEDFGDDLPPEDDFEEDQPPDDELDFENDEPPEEDMPGEEDYNDEDLDSPDDEGFEQEPAEPEDPNRQGMIRTVKGAHLVYKREVEDGTFEELWQYNTSTLRDEITVRKAILAGTDIPVNKSQSPDGSQSFETWAVGNAELLLVKGLQQ